MQNLIFVLKSYIKYCDLTGELQRYCRGSFDLGYVVICVQSEFLPTAKDSTLDFPPFESFGDGRFVVPLGRSGLVRLDDKADRIADYTVWHLSPGGEEYSEFLDVRLSTTDESNVRGKLLAVY